MSGYKNIITWVIKIAIGLGSFFLIYWRIKSDLTPDKLNLLQNVFSSSSSYLILAFCILLIPINWGIESFKWQLITKSIEPVSYGTATRSVYSGVCVGNLAPGRATEFLAKILFFKPDNRPTITLLHFVNGMIQLSVTLLIGVLCLFLKLNIEIALPQHLFWLAVVFAFVLLIIFTFMILNFKKVHTWFLSKFKKTDSGKILPVELSKTLISKLLLWSFIRYAVFALQLLLIIKLFYAGNFNIALLSAIGVYFLLTTALPMISVIEAVIRSAIALVVFEGLHISEIALVVSAVLLWVLNIVVPSIIGYFIIVREKFVLRHPDVSGQDDYKIFKRK